MTNLAEDPRFADQLEQLQQELAQWRKAQEDIFVMDDDPRRLDRPEEWAPEFYGTRIPR